VAAFVEPPIEWVSGEKRWWVYRIVIPAIVLAGLLTFFILEWSATSYLTLSNFYFSYALVFVALGVEFGFLYAFPTVRRIGISPTRLIVDIGLHKFRIPWSEVNQVTRTRINRYGWHQVSSVSRTRISVGDGLWRNWFVLSPEQGDRLASFLRIP
jgi:hypothetical protein